MLSRDDVLFIILILLLNSFVSESVDVVINSETGNDSACLMATTTTPCSSLEYVSSAMQGKSSINIRIEGSLTIGPSEVIRFEKVSNITLSGRGSKIECLENASFLINGVQNFKMDHLKLDHCGGQAEEASSYKAAIFFENSSEINLINITISNTNSTGIVFQRCQGNVIITGVLFNENRKKNCQKCPEFPGGASIEIINVTKSRYSLVNCEFSNNTVSYHHVPYYDIREKINSSIIWIGTGLGGGLGIYFSGHSNGNFVEIKDCAFTNNTAVWGGGMYVHFQDNTYNNSVFITSSYFKNNNALNAGGGADVGYLNNESFQERTNVITFVKTTFESNFANYGGGVGVFSEYSDVKYKPKENIVFNECKWFKNRAVYSPAIDISPYYYRGTQRSGFLPLPLFSNVNITDNYVKNKTFCHSNHTIGNEKTTLHINSGVFVITQFTVYFSGHIWFTRNKYSALHLTSGAIILDENTTMNFSSNIGAVGGAIAMYAFSYITINKNTHIEFVENHADTLGGAIYHHTIDQNDFIIGSTCFIQYNDSDKARRKNVTFHFHNNSAGVGGASIYADSFGNCYHRCVKTHARDGILKVDNITKCIGEFNYSQELSDRNNYGFASSAARFVFGNPKQLEYSVIPGSVLNISFDIKDEFNRTAHPLMSVSVEKPHINSIRISRQSVYTILTNFTPLGRPGESIFVDFTAHGTRGIFFHFNIEMQQCPPGFYFDEEKELCQCSANSHHKKYAPITRCDMGNFSAYMKGKYWVGYIPETQNYSNLYFAPCFFPLCNITSFYLPNVTSELTSSICAENRHGIMCGKCAANHSVSYHSKHYKCSPNHLCHLGILFYLLSEVTPVVILFAIIVILDLSFTSGNIVGFIFFCQYSDGMEIHINEAFSILRNGYRLFYEVFNFEFFLFDEISFCLWKNFQILDIIAFKYIIVCIAFGLVFALVTLIRSNWCSTLWKLRTQVSTKTSFVRGLSAFLVICYNQCTKTSFLILKVVSPVGVNHTKAGIYSYYGGLPYFKGKHLIYAVPALLSCLLVTILPPLILLLYPLTLQILSLCKLSEHWIVNKALQLIRINKLIPFIDCFQSCYKDKFRFFAGLYFIYRIALLCCFTLSQTENEFRMSHGTLLVIFLGVHSVIQPYKLRMHNLIDSLIFLNLILINTAVMISNLIIDEFSHPKKYTKSTSLMIVSVIQLILLYLPMIVAVLWVMVKVCTYFKMRRRNNDYEMMHDDGDGLINSQQISRYENERVSGELRNESDMVNYCST